MKRRRVQSDPVFGVVAGFRNDNAQLLQVSLVAVPIVTRRLLWRLAADGRVCQLTRMRLAKINDDCHVFLVTHAVHSLRNGPHGRWFGAGTIAAASAAAAAVRTAVISPSDYKCK